MLIPSQITTPTPVAVPPFASPRQHVRIHTKLLRLLELHRPSHALYQDLDGRERQEEMRQSTSRAVYCDLGYVQYMPVARTLVTPCTNQEVESIQQALARPVGPHGPQSPQMSKDDAGDVNAHTGGDFTNSTPAGDTKAVGLDLGVGTQRFATEERPCSGCLVSGDNPSEAGEQDYW